MSSQAINLKQHTFQNDFTSQKVLSAIRTSHGPSLKEDLALLSPERLKQVLDEVAEQIKPDEDPAKLLGRLAELIPLETLQEAIRIDYPQHVDALKTAKDLFCQAQYYLETTKETSPTIRARLSAILDSLISVLESILNAFGIADFFRPAESEMHAEMKGHKIMMLISLFTLLSGVLLPVLGPALGGMILGGMILSIAALSIIYPYFRPAPSYLPAAENWTQQIQQGNLVAAGGRKESLNEIARTLIASKNAKTHAMLLGKTGVGKTETAKAFAAAVEQGDYPELKGKKVFYINTADLVNSSEMFSSGNKILSRISQAMGRHREKFILVMDEIHLACQKKEHSAISEQLKTYLDAGKESFPYVIGITTEEEFYRDIYVNNAAFARRFKRISIENTEDSETLKILNHSLLKQAPKTILEPNAVQTLLKKTQDAFGAAAAQPATSLKILSQCLKRTASSQKSPLEAKVEQVRGRIQSIYSQGAVMQGTSLLPYNKNQDATQLEEDLRRLEAELEKEKGEIDQLFKTRDRLAALKASTFQTVLEVSELAQKNLLPKDKKKLNGFLLQSHFLTPALEKEIHSAAKRLGVKMIVDSSLIDQVIQEELENDRKVQEMIEKGKQQIAARTA